MAYNKPSIHTPSNDSSSITDRGSFAIELGLDEATLASYPKLLYPQAKLQSKANHSLASCCSICLGDYEDKWYVTVIAWLWSYFHLKCMDCWLRLDPTSPICQKLPVPTLSTPLAEVAASIYWSEKFVFLFQFFREAVFSVCRHVLWRLEWDGIHRSFMLGSLHWIWDININF